ncbi:MAG: ABC transporter permease [Trueperaceae bacterium]|nr:MAG: ABC transporter permease [Trueperaceae bacterium]
MDSTTGVALEAVTEKPRGSVLQRWWASKTMQRFRRNPLALTGALIVLAFIVTATIAPLITSPGRNCLRDLGLSAGTVSYAKNPTKAAFWKVMFTPPETCYAVPRVGFSPVPKSAAESNTLLGTTSRGYDIFYGLVWGTRTAFRIGVIVVGVSLIMGLLVGSVAAYFGGWVDSLLMRFTDVVIAVPALVLALVIVTVLGISINNLMIAIAIVSWPNYARVLRGDILQVKELEYVTSARALGRRAPGLIFKHILPNSIGPLVIIASLDIGSIVLTAAALSFLGLGAPIGYADWGQMISFAREWILGPPGQPLAYWYVSFWPGLIIVLFVLGWNLLGDAFRDVLDPRSA